MSCLKLLIEKIATLGFLLIIIMLVAACQPEANRKQKKRTNNTNTGNSESVSSEYQSVSGSYTPIEIPEEPLSPEEVNSLCSPSTFQIFTSSEFSEGSGTGTGFLVYPGYIATNLHVIDLNDDDIPDDPTLISVRLGKGENSLVINIQDVAAYDPDYDLAILKVSLKEIRGYNSLPLLPSYPKVGEDVYAIGNPLGLVTKNFTQGHVTQVSKINVENSKVLIVFDASISPGNSGGPLLNKFGVVVGVTTAYLDQDKSAQNINIAIPSQHVIRLLKKAII